MANPESTPQTLVLSPSAAHAVARFDAQTLTSFTLRSPSAETRRAYRRVIREFFARWPRHPARITADEIRQWRDEMLKARKSRATIIFKLSVMRSLFDYLQGEGIVSSNPATTKKVPPPRASEALKGRVLEPKEVRLMLAGPDRRTADGARDYALLLLLVRTSLRVSEGCGLKSSDIRWSHGRWVLRMTVKGGGERSMPLPSDVKRAVDEYLKLDRGRRNLVQSGGVEAWLFQPHTNYRTLEYNKPLSATMAWHVVKKWGEYCGVGKVSPHDLRRTAITRALDQGLSYRQVQMMSGHRDPKTVMRYDHHRENMEHNAVNFLSYEEDEPSPS